MIDNAKDVIEEASTMMQYAKELLEDPDDPIAQKNLNDVRTIWFTLGKAACSLNFSRLMAIFLF